MCCPSLGLTPLLKLNLVMEDWGQNLPPKLVNEYECIAEQRAILSSSMTNAVALGRAGFRENSGEGGEKMKIWPREIWRFQRVLAMLKQS